MIHGAKLIETAEEAQRLGTRISSHQRSLSAFALLDAFAGLLVPGVFIDRTATPYRFSFDTSKGETPTYQAQEMLLTGDHPFVRLVQAHLSNAHICCLARYRSPEEWWTRVGYDDQAWLSALGVAMTSLVKDNFHVAQEPGSFLRISREAYLAPVPLYLYEAVEVPELVFGAPSAA